MSTVQRLLPRSVLLLSLGLLTVLPAPAADIDVKGKAPAPADVAAKVEEYMRARVAVHQFSGSILIAKGGQIVVSKGYGLANREHDVANIPQTKFRIGSVTKQFTVMAILLLEKQGKLKVDDPIARHLPDAPATWKDVTIHHLMSHTAGIPEYTSTPAFREIRTTTMTLPKIIAMFKDKPLDFKPGEMFRYSNAGYILLGQIIETVSGKSYEEFVRTNIFTPLQMNDSGYDHFKPVLQHRATGYARDGSTLVNSSYFDMSIPHAAGALYSTVEDLNRWDQALYEAKLLPRATLDRMFTIVRWNYGYGWTIGTKFNRKSQGHGGSIYGFRSMVTRFPEEKVYVVVLSNVEGTPVDAINRDLAAIVFGEKYEIPEKN